MIAEVVSQTAVLAMLRLLAPSSAYGYAFPEVAAAISTAANHDPLFPHRKDGCELTAAILVGLAWHESRFHPNAVGDRGKSFGLYQIQPPTANVDGKLLLIPRNASYVAIDLIRTSFQRCDGRPWDERLTWYAASQRVCIRDERIVSQSRERMQTAMRVFRATFPQRPLLLSSEESSSTRKDE